MPGFPPNQQCAFVTDLDRKSAGASPDRVDALVWALTDLLVEPMPGYAYFELARQDAEEIKRRQIAEEEARKPPKPQPAPGSVEYTTSAGAYPNC